MPNKATHGYDEGLIEATEGDKVTVRMIEGKEVNISLDIQKILLRVYFYSNVLAR